MSSPSFTFRPSSTVTRHLPAFAAVAVVGVVLIAGVAGGFGGRGGTSGPNPVGPAPASSDPAETVSPQVGLPPSTQAVVVEPSEPEREVTSLAKPLGRGFSNSDVVRLQERLTELGFFPGPVDGQFGPLTEKAVWAFEKLVLQVPRDKATGIVTDEMWQFMQQPIEIQPRRKHADGEATKNHTEVYLPEQVVIFFEDDEPAIISHMSSGTGEDFAEVVTIDPGEIGNEKGEEPIERRELGKSITPGGVFKFDRMIEGNRESALGTLWDPAYFNYGIAIHGAMNVPLEPASHGCIRLPREIGKVFHDYVALGDQVFVWDGLKEPEHYAQNPNKLYPDGQLPYFNRVDPTYTTTTTSTIPTTVPTTLPSSTTQAPSTPAPTEAPTTTLPPTTAAPTQPPTTTTQPPATTTTTVADPAPPG